nr:cysteine-rich KTR domain-containing protein [uncultured Agathobaculum sp.]
MYNDNRRVKLVCPRCGKPTNVMVIKGCTVLRDFPLWCQKCKTETVVSYDGSSRSQRA